MVEKEKGHKQGFLEALEEAFESGKIEAHLDTKLGRMVKAKSLTAYSLTNVQSLESFAEDYLENHEDNPFAQEMKRQLDGFVGDVYFSFYTSFNEPKDCFRIEHAFSNKNFFKHILTRSEPASNLLFDTFVGVAIGCFAGGLAVSPKTLEFRGAQGKIAAKQEELVAERAGFALKQAEIMDNVNALLAIQKKVFAETGVRVKPFEDNKTLTDEEGSIDPKKIYNALQRESAERLNHNAAQFEALTEKQSLIEEIIKNTISKCVVGGGLLGGLGMAIVNGIFFGALKEIEGDYEKKGGRKI